MHIHQCGSETVSSAWEICNILSFAEFSAKQAHYLWASFESFASAIEINSTIIIKKQHLQLVLTNFGLN